jgi:hypothetical protein
MPKQETMSVDEYRALTAKKRGPVRIAASGFQRDRKYKSGAEREWAEVGYRYLEQEIDASIVRLVYEPFVLTLPGARKYRIDFFGVSQDYVFHMIAVKGYRSHKLASYADSRAALKECAELYPWARYWQADKRGAIWEIREIDAGNPGPYLRLSGMAPP